ncbi:MAG TPA: trypsin-like peptidase domain-containing protein [Candidatus Moranbacteria bacterium]|nr:trypsin-like peptidase domain-containing protein [Candidatus Moranbacteria bacterium]
METANINSIQKNPNEASAVLPAKPASRKSFFAVVLVLSVLVSSCFGAVFGFIGGSVSQKVFEKGALKSIFRTKKNAGLADIVKQQVIEEDSGVIDVVEKSTPAVVSIVITKDVPKMRGVFGNPFFSFPDLFEENQGGATEKQKIGGGTGFFISNDGMIATNKHVVSDTAADYTVITNEGKEYPAKVLARDPINDIAVIKIDGSDFPTLNFGDSEALKTGQTVIAIGNSLGEFSNTVSRGIISGLKRNLTAGGGSGETEKLSNIIQTDAAINSGNSGGPLLNISGEVVGINVAMAQGAQNVGFAIPSNQIKKIIDQVKKTGKITTPYIGIRYIPINDSIKNENNLPYDYGVLVARGQKITDFAVIPGSPADKAGLVENDIVLEIDGKKITEDSSFSNMIASYSVGDTITLKVWHKGDMKSITVVLEERK